MFNEHVHVRTREGVILYHVTFSSIQSICHKEYKIDKQTEQKYSDIILHSSLLIAS